MKSKYLSQTFFLSQKKKVKTFLVKLFYVFQFLRKIFLDFSTKIISDFLIIINHVFNFIKYPFKKKIKII